MTKKGEIKEIEKLMDGLRRPCFFCLTREATHVASVDFLASKEPMLRGQLLAMCDECRASMTPEEIAAELVAYCDNVRQIQTRNN